jgi:hypothetical protein
MACLVEGGAHEVVHARVDHEPAPWLGDLALDDARDEDTMSAHQRAAGLAVES